jgi:hypothetical protein
MTTYSITRTVFRCAALDLLDLECGGGTIWGQTARDAADLIGGKNLPDPFGRPAKLRMGPEWLRIRAIVRIARACMAAFSAPYPVDHAVMNDVLGDNVTAASLVGTPFAYYRRWWKPPAAAGVATTRRMTPEEAERRAGLELAIRAQREQAENKWRNVHEDVTKVRTDEPMATERQTRPYEAVRPPK